MHMSFDSLRALAIQMQRTIAQTTADRNSSKKRTGPKNPRIDVIKRSQFRKRRPRNDGRERNSPPSARHGKYKVHGKERRKGEKERVGTFLVCIHYGTNECMTPVELNVRPSSMWEHLPPGQQVNIEGHRGQLIIPLNWSFSSLSHGSTRLAVSNWRFGNFLDGLHNGISYFGGFRFPTFPYLSPRRVFSKIWCLRLPYMSSNIKAVWRQEHIPK